MSIEINGLPPSIPPGAGDGSKVDGTQGRQDAPAPAEGKPNESSQSGDKVSLTNTAHQLTELTEQVKGLPVVDTQRVEAVRAAVQSGTYEIDAGRVADKLVGLEQALGERN